MKFTWLVLALCAVMAVPASAQDAASTGNTDKYVEMLRTDWKSDRVAIVTEALDLNDAQGAEFWPIYREYDAKLAALNDQRYQLIKDFAGQYSTMTDDGAKDLMKRAFKLRDQRNSMLESYAGKVEKKLGGRVAARWAQTEAALHSLVDIALASELPLVK